MSPYLLATQDHGRVRNKQEICFIPNGSFTSLRFRLSESAVRRGQQVFVLTLPD